ncbi:unnamed protein product, partial [Laminaria digitata]
DFVETHICELRVILRSRVLRVVYDLMEEIGLVLMYATVALVCMYFEVLSGTILSIFIYPLVLFLVYPFNFFRFVLPLSRLQTCRRTLPVQRAENSMRRNAAQTARS